MLSRRLRQLFERLGLGLLGLALPLVFYTAAEDAYRLPQLIVLCLACLCLAATWNAPLKPGPGVLMAGAFFAWRLASHLAAGAQGDWLLEQSLYAFAFFWSAAHLGDQALASRLKAALLTGAALAALYAIFQSYGLDPFASGRASQGFGSRAHSSLGNPDFWGGYLILAMPFAFGHAALLALFAVALVLSQTRAAWLGFAAGAALMLGKGSRRGLGLAAGFGLAALLLTSFPNPLNPGTMQSLQRLASSVQTGHGDAQGRFFMDRISFGIAARHPLLGAGAGHFTDAYLAEQGRLMSEPGHAAEPYRYTHDAHNDWLQLAAESGFPALLLFGALVALALSSAWKQEQWALAALISSFCVNALLHFPLDIVPSAAIVWTALGWSLARRPSGQDALSPRFLALLRFNKSAFFICACFFFMRRLESSAFLNRGMSLSLAGQFQEADEPLKAALRLSLRDERAWMRLGLDFDAEGNLPAAEAAFSRCQSTPEGLANLGLSQAKQGRLDDGKAASMAALQLNPRSTEALGNLGKIEYLRGNPAGAEAIYLQGLQIDPDWAAGHFNLAAIYINTGRKAQAKGQLQEALRLDPSNAQAAQLLAGLK
jgi:tetratricopeptide (TPR) repeat protein